MTLIIIKEFDEWIEKTYLVLYDGGWNFGPDDYALFEKIKNALKQPDTVKRIIKCPCGHEFATKKKEKIQCYHCKARLEK